MTFFRDVNQDAISVTPDMAATGPRVGFLQAFETSFNVQTRAAAVFGIQEAMRNKEDAQRQALRKAGVENIPSLSQQADDPMRMFTDFGQDYIDTAKFYEDGGDPKMGDRLKAYDERILALRNQYPDLHLYTSKDLWDSVRMEAQQYERRAATERTDLGGAIGGFVGGMAGALNPNTDPVNFATLPVGGAGRNIAIRIAGQAGAQGAVETINQFTGVQEQRRLLGLDYGFADAATRVGGAVVGGAAVQGVGEVIGFGFRRMFRATPKDPVPQITVPPREQLPPATGPEGAVPADELQAAATLAQRPQAYYDFMNQVSPLGGTRAGRARFQDDITHVEMQLDAWDGPAPWAVPPKTDTATTLHLNDFTRVPDLQAAAGRASVDALARKVDPQTMERYDELVSEQQAIRQQLAAATGDRDASLELQKSTGLTEAADAIARLDTKIAKASAKNRKRLNTERTALVAQRDTALAEASITDTPSMAVIRGRLVAIDEKMRDMAELVSRAYARVRGKWSSTDAEREALLDMMREGRTDVGPTPESAAFVDNVQRTLVDDVPMLAERPEGMKEDADAADVVKAVLDKRAELADEATETWKSEAARIVKDAEKQDELTPQQKREAKSGSFVSMESKGYSLLDSWEITSSGVKRKVGIAAVKVGDDVFTGADHAEALDKAIAKQGAKAGQRIEAEPEKHFGYVSRLEPGTYKIDGFDEPIDINDRLTIVDEATGDERTVTIREMLTEQVERDEDLKAVQSCSIR